MDISWIQSRATDSLKVKNNSKTRRFDIFLSPKDFGYLSLNLTGC